MRPGTDVLAGARSARATRDAAEVALALTTVEWCAVHSTSSDDEALWLAGYGDHGLSLGGPGCPLVRESAVLEYAAALGLSTPSGCSYVGDVLELRYRLPRLWERVVAGGCPLWRARRVAAATASLCEDGADFVDTHVAGFAHSISAAQLDRVVEDALARFDPQEAESRRRSAAEDRHVSIDLEHAAATGVADVRGRLDLPDALDLDRALAERAHALKDLGCDEALPVRRALALGDLARGQAVLLAGGAAEVSTSSTTEDTSTNGRAVVLHVHLSEAALRGGAAAESERGRIGDVHGVHGSVPVSAVRDWCASAARITVRPVLDLAEAIPCESYEASDRLRAQTEPRDRTCVFPFCTRPSVHCDAEHPVPWPVGRTESHNQAPMCRRHHRAKTHMTWTYTVLTAGLYLWRSPTGLRYLRSHAGTHQLDRVSTSSTTEYPPLPETAPVPRWRPLPRTITAPRTRTARPPVDTVSPPF